MLAFYYYLFIFLIFSAPKTVSLNHMFSIFSSSDYETSFVYNCHHCKMYKTSVLNEMVDHCKTCTYMPRPNMFIHKYVCFMCEYRTYNIELIRAHICSHSGERPYKCTHCSFACARQSNLSKHFKSKHKM